MNELLWFASRAAGAASIVTLTAVFVLGMVTASRRVPAGYRSAVVMGLHRSLALGSVAFLVVHVATAVVETFVSIDWVSVVLPFTSAYQTAWVGLGTLALDVLVAVLGTSLLRHRLPERVWRAVHWLAYAFWPLALVHGLGMSTSDQPLLRWITIASGAIGVAAVVWRFTTTDPDASRRQAVVAQEWS